MQGKRIMKGEKRLRLLRMLYFSEFSQGEGLSKGGILNDFVKELEGSQDYCYKFLREMIEKGAIVFHKEIPKTRNGKETNGIVLLYVVNRKQVLGLIRNDRLFQLDYQILKENPALTPN